MQKETLSDINYPVASDEGLSYFFSCVQKFLRGEGVKTLRPEIFEAFSNENLCYYYANEQLQEPYLSKFVEIYHDASANALYKELGMQKIYKILRDNSIKFCPIKGSDLSIRCYPSSTLRNYSDFDILIHPSDIKRAWQVFLDDGFESYSAEEVWANMEGSESTGFRLPLAMNIFLLFYHCKKHQWEIGIKALLDIKFLLKDLPWPSEELAIISQKVKHADATLMAVTFPELFAENLPNPPIYAPEIKAALRRLVVQQFQWDKVDVFCNRVSIISLKWVKKALDGISLRNISRDYKVLPHQKLKLYKCLIIDVSKKFYRLFKAQKLKHNYSFRTRLSDLSALESFVDHPQEHNQ